MKQTNNLDIRVQNLLSSFKVDSPFTYTYKIMAGRVHLWDSSFLIDLDSKYYHLEKNESANINSGIYKVSNNILVPEGSSLEISPATILLFEKHKGIEVRGRLIAQGEKENKIIFSALVESFGDKALWKNISLFGSQKDSIFKHCYISRGAGFYKKDEKNPAKTPPSKAEMVSHGGAFYIGTDNVTIADCLIEFNEATFGGGIHIIKSNPKIIRTAILGNNAFLGGGLYIQDSEPKFENSLLVSNYATKGNQVFLDKKEKNYVLNGISLHPSEDTNKVLFGDGDIK